MGQKVNPIIFRLGANKNWKTEFFEKKVCELPFYFFNTLEIENFINRFFESHNVILHNYKSYQTNSTLVLYVSYFVTHTHNKIISVNKNNKDILSNKTKFQTVFEKHSSYNLKNYLVNVKLINKRKLIDFKVEQALNKFFKVLSLFTRNNCFIIVNFCCINKNLNFLKKFQNRSFGLLQKFKKTVFLKDGVELLFHTVHHCNSANLLAKFIAIQVKKEKRHNFFLSFLKQILLILLNSKFSKIKGIKVNIKGKINGMPRAKTKTICIGNIPIQTVNASIDYCQTATHNTNGTYGIKVWVFEKLYIVK